MAITRVLLKPLGERVVIQRLPSEEKSTGGIILPDTAQEKPLRGEVLAVGPGKVLDSGERAPMEVRVGQTVLFGKYGGTEVKIEGEELVILEQREILGIFEG